MRPVPEITLPPGCAGLDLRSKFGPGAKYDPSDGRHVTVDNPDHLKAIRLLGDTYNVGERVAVTADQPGWDCGCGFSAYRFQRTCPRCGEGRPDSSEWERTTQ